MPRYDDGTLFTSINKPTIVLVGTTAEYGEISIDDLRIVIAETLSLEELQDVVITTIQDKQVLQWDTVTFKWVNANFNLDGLTDVVLTSVAQGDIFVYNGTNWVNLAKGTANQLLGMNNAATAQEYKTLAGTTNQVTVTHSVGGITLALPQSLATTSSPTFAALSLTAALTAPNGGTGQSSYAIGDILYASTSSALSKLAGVATGNSLISGGVGAAPSWGKIGLTTHISGTLAVGNGGLGITTTPSNGFLPIGNGTNYVAAALTGTANQITVTNASGSITLSLPQSIATSSAPQFDKLGIGTSSLTGFNLRVNRSITGSTTVSNIFSQGQIQSDVTANVGYFESLASTQATAFTLTNLYHFKASVSSFGAGSTVTNQFGYIADSSIVGGTNNYGFYGNLPSASTNWNLYMNGTAASFLNGNLQIGSSTPLAGAEKLQVTGTARVTGALAIGNTVAASVATPSTHKVTIVIGGVTYYLLATNV